MVYTTFTHRIGETEAKISIHSADIEGEIYYYGKVINIADKSYQKLSEPERSTFYGVKINDVNRDTLIYSDPEKLKSDILEKYGKDSKEPLITQHVRPDFLDFQ